MIVPDSALVHEGTSQNYHPLETERPRICPSRELTAALTQYCRNRDLDVKNRSVWTTDGIYRETPQKATYFKNAGAAAVEMECSALFSVAAFHQKEIAALLIVSDILSISEKTPSQWQPSFRNPEFKAARKKACDIILDFAGDLSTHAQ